MRIFIVQGVQPTVPGIVLKTFADRASAVEEAVSLVNIIAGRKDATAANWEKVLAGLQKKHGHDDCDVWITEQDLQGGPLPAATNQLTTDLIGTLVRAEAFVAGFEGDTLQEGIDGPNGLLAAIRGVIARAGGAPADAETATVRAEEPV